MKTVLDNVRRVPGQITERLTLALLCAVFCGELFFSVRQLSQTADEATHLYSGYRYLTCGDLTVSPEHPPLAKIVAAIPLLPMNLAVNCSLDAGSGAEQAVTSAQWLYSQDWRPALARARIAMSVFAVGLCLLVWTAGRRMFDFATAATATLLLIFEPNVLAFGGLVMTDAPVTCMLLFAAYAFYLWVKNRTAPFLLLTSLATGLTLLAKHSGVVVVPILFALAVADAFIAGADSRPVLRSALRNLMAVVLICALAVVIVWAGYGMRFAANPSGTELPALSADATSISARILSVFKHYHLLPEAYLEGFAGALSISSHSGPVFVAGKIYPQAPWFMVPLQLLIRSTSAMAALFLMAVYGVFVIFRLHRRELLFLLIPAGIFLAICLGSSMIGGVRYLLPVFPFVLIAVAAGCAELARRRRWVRYAVPSLVLLHAVSSLHAYPNYLSYADEFWGGPASAYKYLSWLDAGQADLEAKTYLERHPAENCWYITGWQWDPRLYGVTCQTFGLYLPNDIPPRVHGTVILSSTLLTDVRLPEGELAAPFKNITPKAKIGGSALLVYEGDFDTRLAAAVSERDSMKRAFSAGEVSTALLHGRRAVELGPDSALAHSDLCALLARTGQLDAALNECQTAQRLLQHDPLRDEPFRKQYLHGLDNALTQLRERYGSIYGRDAAVVPPASGADPR